MPWQIQVRRKHDGREWEPISVERCRIVPGAIDGAAHERQFHYESLDDVKLAFFEYVDMEGGLPNLLVRLATGRPKFTDKYDVRFVWISQPGIVWCRETLPEPPDLASDPNSNTEIPTEKLVPIWIRDYIRDYVQQQLNQQPEKLDSLGDAVPPASESALRGGCPEESPPWKNRYSSRILRAENHQKNPEVPDGKIEVTFRVTDEEYQALIATPLPQSDSTLKPAPDAPSESRVRWMRDNDPAPLPRPHRIGVYDYESCISCLRINYKKAFGDDSPLTDPQDMIQRMAAEIQELRRKQEKEN